MHYFYASNLEWLPIYLLIVRANQRFHLGMSPQKLHRFTYKNEDAYLVDPDDCQALARALERMLSETDAQRFDSQVDATEVDEGFSQFFDADLWKAMSCPDYGTSRERVEEFIDFLKRCDWFQIW